MKKQSELLEFVTESINRLEDRAALMEKYLRLLIDEDMNTDEKINRLCNNDITLKLLRIPRTRSKLMPFLIELVGSELAETQLELDAASDPLAIAMQLKELQEKAKETLGGHS